MRFSNLWKKYVLRKSRSEILRANRLNSKHRFEDRQQNKSELLILICGYKQELWPFLFERLERALIPMDVCIVCPGFEEHAQLERKAEAEDWSILLCKKNQVSVAVNLAVKKHPKADRIFKVDEDMMLPKGFFSDMLSLLGRLDQEAQDFAYLAPLINVNGYSYHRLLDQLSKRKEYEERFGPATSSCMGIPAWSDPEAASFLWDICQPFDQIAAELNKKSNSYTVCPHRFSIGAILFHRKLWQDIDYLETGREGQLGLDEKQLAEYCSNHSKLVAVSEEILAGHFSFGPQWPGMLEKLKKDDSFLRMAD